LNALGWLILGSIAHATVFAVIGSIAYVALRRWIPAAGALAAGSSLVITAIVSIIAVGPWPRWWIFTTGQIGQSTETASRAMPKSNQALGLRGADRLAPAPDVPGEKNTTSPIPENETASARAWMSRFVNELGRTVVARERPHWNSPAWAALGFFASLGLGLARLALGVLSIRRLRTSSMPIDDADLFDIVEILRAELSCSRRVEIRETSELATPATIGWRRPLLAIAGRLARLDGSRTPRCPRT
jgi:hypothetical protein